MIASGGTCVRRSPLADQRPGSVPRVSAARVAVVAALAAAVTWAVKAVAIGLAGGLDKSSWESPLFAFGFVLLLIALAAIGAAVTAGRPVWQRVLAAVGTVVGGVAATLGLDWLAGVLLSDSTEWVQEEAGLWAAALLTALVAIAVIRRASGDYRAPAAQ